MSKAYRTRYSSCGRVWENCAAWLYRGHIHVLNSGVRHVMAADCDVPTLKQVRLVEGASRKTPAGGWVQGFKFDDTKTDRTLLNEGRHLYREDLDAVTKDHPILVAHRAGHVFYMNTAGLEAAGITTKLRIRREAGWSRPRYWPAEWYGLRACN
ncbi:MAG: hypothetical protein Ct9H300mP11_14190 [Chloroflexota bacterium]|nr:MAG: hypothetical protein Ct9H300mP11_14190 [Chloroflexota bacterium]